MHVETEDTIGQDEIAAVVARLEAKSSEAQEETEPDGGDVEPEGDETEETDAGEEPTEETEPEEKPEEQPESKRIAALARRESKLVRKQQELQRERQQLDQERQQIQQFAQLPKLAKQDPAKALQALGLSYEEITEALLGGGTQAQPVTRDDLAEMERRLKTEREQLEHTRQVEAFKREVDDHVRKAGDTYELINLQGKSSLVMEVIEEAYQQHGRLLDIDEAAKLVEEHLEEEAERLLSAKKIGAKRQSAPSTTKPPPKKAERKTLAGLGTTSGATAPAASSGDDEEDFQRAIAAYHKAKAR